MTIVYLNGEFLPIDEAHISPLDRGFLFGDGVYEFIPVYQGKPFLLLEHLQRLNRSLEALDIHVPYKDTEWINIVQTLSAQAPTPSHGIYLQITRGAGTSRTHNYPSGLTPTIFAMVSSIRLLSADDIQYGLSAITMPDLRWAKCYIKSINLLPNVLAYQAGINQGAVETILIDHGYVTEGTSSNVFIVKQGILLTPPKTPDILWGITRDFILRLAREHHIAYEELPISEDELYDADEIWITSSGRAIVPITRLNGHVVGDGLVGPLWKKLHALYQTTEAS